MLSFSVHADDLAKRWKLSGSTWCAGRSIITPYRHRALHADMITTTRRSAVIVRELVRRIELPNHGPTPRSCTEREFENVVGEAKSWPLDFIVLTMTHAEDAHTLRLTCGRWGTAPIYLHAAGRVLRGNWDATKLYPHLRSTALDPGFVAQYLAILEYPYSRRTIFPEIAMLTERASASWSAPFGVPKIRYPSAEDHATARRKTGTDVVGAMREILTASMQRWLHDDREDVAVEFSGGLDSTAVAAAAASIATGGVRSYGMIMPGQPGIWQSRRRNAVIRRFRLRDRNFPCADEPPFNPRSRRIRDHATVPWGEFYDEAVGVLLDLAREDGASLIFTGMGGDELCSYQPGEIADGEEPAAETDAAQPAAERFPRFLTAKTIDAFEQRDALIDDAPQSLLDTSTLESAAAVSTLYLTHGLWPVSPLVTPELVQFCRRLPFALRHKRLIQRRLLTSYGLGPTVAYANPKRLEDFGDVMTFAMHNASAATIAPLFEESRLAEQGYVDRSELVKAYRRTRTSGNAYSDQLVGATVLELALRAVEGQRSRRREPLPVGATRE